MSFYCSAQTSISFLMLAEEVHKLSGLKNTEIYCFTVIQARILKPRCNKSHVSSKTHGGMFSYLTLLLVWLVDNL